MKISLIVSQEKFMFISIKFTGKKEVPMPKKVKILTQLLKK